MPSVGPELWAALILLSAALGAPYRERGYDIGDLRSFVFVLTGAFVPLGILANGVYLLAGQGKTGDEGLVVIIAGAYVVTFWYVYAGGRKRVRGRHA